MDSQTPCWVLRPIFTSWLPCARQGLKLRDEFDKDPLTAFEMLRKQQSSWQKKGSFLTSPNTNQSHSFTLLLQGTGYDLIHIWSWGCIMHAEHKAFKRLTVINIWILDNIQLYMPYLMKKLSFRGTFRIRSLISNRTLLILLEKVNSTEEDAYVVI